jgi:hypothetical protein
MNYLYHEKKVDDELQKKNEWIELFDLVYVNCAVTCFVFVLVLFLFKLYSLLVLRDHANLLSCWTPTFNSSESICKMGL